MAQITEDYVSFKTTMFLKEKGFDWEDSPFYSEQDRDNWRRNHSYTVPNKEYNPELPFDSETLTLVAPHVSFQMAMKWLREVHNIHIEPRYFPMPNIYRYVIIHSPATIENIDSHPRYFSSYEDTCEAAIKYCLENLI